MINKQNYNSVILYSLLSKYPAAFPRCGEIQSVCPTCKSGVYSVDHNGEVLKYYCDMVAANST